MAFSRSLFTVRPHICTLLLLLLGFFSGNVPLLLVMGLLIGHCVFICTGQRHMWLDVDKIR